MMSYKAFVMHEATASGLLKLFLHCQTEIISKLLCDGGDLVKVLRQAQLRNKPSIHKR